MIQQVLNKQLILDVLDSMQSQAESLASDRRRDSTGTPVDDMTPAEIAELQENIAIAKQHARGESAPAEGRRGDTPLEISAAERNTWIPHSAELSNLQSAIEEYFLQKRPELVESSQPGERRRGSGPVAGSQLTIWQEYLSDRRAFGAFEPVDIGWVNSLFSEGIRKFRGRHPFVNRPIRREPIPFHDENVRMIVFGDWGSGVPRAQDVANWIANELADGSVQSWQKFVIHLGDVYYSGWKSEYQKRFLDYWPVKPADQDSIGSFTLNGNHDMYSGGWDYYNCALADSRFAPWQGKSSLFHLTNSYWQLFGLDTSHEDGGLRDDQAAWMTGAARKGLKTMLLSHHQYCSSYETAPKTLVEKIDPVLKQLDVAAWLWGHEHRCMTYKDVPRIRFPRCLGHGGVPVYQSHDAEAEPPKPGEWEYRAFDVSGIEHWARFGYAVLDFQRDKIFVRYVNEQGGTDRTETIE